MDCCTIKLPAAEALGFALLAGSHTVNQLLALPWQHLRR
jgi:hypothetical protein